MSLMAKSCFSPGLIALLSNLITSSADFNRELNRNAFSPTDVKEEKWLDEYCEGMGHEIYRVKLSEKMEKKYF